jgi:hypothetical protein
MAGGELWTPEEDKYLIESYAMLGRRACSDHLGRPVNGVSCRAYALGIQADVAWTEREDSVLKELYSTIGRAGCAKLLPGRTISSVGVRAGLLGLTNDRRHTATPDELAIIRTNYAQRGGRKKCAQLLPHFTPCAISHLAERLGVLQRDRSQWTDKENQILGLNYANKGKYWCAQRLLERSPKSIVVQARKLGLAIDPRSEYYKDWQARAAASKRGRSKPGFSDLVRRLWKEGRIPKPIFTAERRQQQSEMMRHRHARYGNPNKGKRLSDDTKLKMSAASRRMWSDPAFSAKMRTPERREARRKNSSESWIRSGRANENAYSRCCGGRRGDPGDLFFRSGWEANYARILNVLVAQNRIHRWEYEPDPFRFPLKYGPLSYTPDFKVWEVDGGTHYYVEIKGWMDEKSRLKHLRMAQFHPDVPIRIIGPAEYKSLQAEYSSQIERWEFYSSRYVAKRRVA